MRRSRHFHLWKTTPASIAALGVLTWMVYKAYLFAITLGQQLGETLK